MRRAVVVAVIGLMLAVAVRGAGAGATQSTGIEDVGEALRRDPVYVDSGASRTITEAEATQLRDAIRGGSQPVFVAVTGAGLLEAARGSPDALVTSIARTTGLAGTYGVVAGESFRAVSSTVRIAPAIATAAFQAHRDEGPAAVLEDFVRRVEQVATAGPAGAPVSVPSTGTPAAEDGSGPGALPWVVGIGGGVAAFAFWRSRRRRTGRIERARQREADRHMVEAELSVLGDDVVGLADVVALHPEARADYDAGVSRYRAAVAALESARDQIDLVRLERVIQEGSYAMARVRARVDGRPPPAPPESLQRPGHHGEPPVSLDEHAAPMYVGGQYPFYGGGWFGGGSGLFP